MGLRPLEIFEFFQRGGRLYTSESDVCRRQNLTYKDVPRAETAKSSTSWRKRKGNFTKTITHNRYGKRPIEYKVDYRLKWCTIFTCSNNPLSAGAEFKRQILTSKVDPRTEKVKDL